MKNKCIECENEAMLDLSSLQVDFYDLEEDYKKLDELYESLNEHYSFVKKQRDNFKQQAKMWHDDFIQKSKELDIFRNDPYFENLNLEQISALAKKSIKLTSDNNDMIHDFEEIKTLLENLTVFDGQEALKQAIELTEKHII